MSSTTLFFYFFNKFSISTFIFDGDTFGAYLLITFPCNQFANQDSESNEKIHQFCQLNYGVTFTMFEKIVVNGKDAHPLYKYLKSEAKGLLSKEIKWNFTKFLIDSQGNVIKRYAPNVSPSKINVDIENLLKK